jgi:hypothetical protein
MTASGEFGRVPLEGFQVGKPVGIPSNVAVVMELGKMGWVELHAHEIWKRRMSGDGSAYADGAPAYADGI